jgi:two-component system chemotaxis response regulator CheY
MGYSILLVDDSNIVRKSISKALAIAGIETSTLLEAANGAEALHLLDSAWVDLILLDINMPVMNGVEFLEKLRQHPEHSSTKVIVVSTEGSSVRRAQLEELGISFYLRKPVTPESLTTTIEAVLNGGGQ